MMSNLLPPNATDLEKNLSDVVEHATALPVDVKSVWNPDTCPADMLPWLAWAMSIDNWKPYWPESVKRTHLKRVADIHRHKGTVSAVRNAVESFGAPFVLQEWFEKTPQGVPHTFEVILTLGQSVPNTAEYQQDIYNEITRTKPVRSHFTLVAGLSGYSTLGIRAVAHTASFQRLSLVGV
jgi:phage tail P2-like protein